MALNFGAVFKIRGHNSILTCVDEENAFFECETQP
jgi:hypothetical protein